MTLSAALLAAAAVALRRGRRHVVRTSASRRRRPRRDRQDFDAALTLDVLAACVEAGATPSAAVRAAAATASSATQAALVALAAALDAGDDPHDAWRTAVAHERSLTPAGRAFGRTAVTGAAVADELRRAAEATRSARTSAQRRRVQRASVWVVLPLGLCFLPAFVLVGVVPLVAAALPGFSR